MTKLSSENQLVKKINNVCKSDLYYDKNRFTLFIYSDNATDLERKKIQGIFLNHVDLNNLQAVYSKMVIYS